MIPQCETERLLTEHLAGTGSRSSGDVELISFVEQPDGSRGHAAARWAGRNRTTAAWLTGCDGAHSTVRHTLGHAVSPVTAEPNQWMLADVHLTGAVADGRDRSLLAREGGVGPLSRSLPVAFA